MPIKYKLRQTAINDLNDIGRYTLRNYGKVQRDKYLTGLGDRFELLGENPNFGRPRDDIKSGYHCSNYNKHVVFYLIRKNHVEILAVLHESMIPEFHL
ncbi:MAG: type II toxin-antitoxin system RelE/ParE family toxin [Pseudomonadales bacterium]|nr:type II toxin-antitoxin system RelE/ParE family toxin [Pseudomonadales bacterium]